uniref:NdWFamide n=1 Tax=Mizuhopecten yessoensis TaxID=6573 RepID=A0A346GAV3_MIZYE|nr:NdWFamide [Mizuhopecten yessoensis]
MTVIVLLFCSILMSSVLLSNANWYGKRGSEVDDAFQRYLEGRLVKSIGSRHSDDREILFKISKLLQEWQLKNKANEVAEVTSYDRK